MDTKELAMWQYELRTFKAEVLAGTKISTQGWVCHMAETQERDCKKSNVLRSQLAREKGVEDEGKWEDRQEPSFLKGCAGVGKWSEYYPI